MKQGYHSLHSKHLSLQLLLSCSLLAGFVFCLAFCGPSARAAELLDEISSSDLTTQNVKSALDVLKTQIDKTRRELPVGLTNEFEQSIVARLATIREGVGQHISTEYKSEMMAKRILELSEHVMALPYRQIPEDAQQRKQAQRQYATVLDRCEKLVPDSAKHLSELSRTAISGALRQLLTDVQQDMFRHGYGRPLSDHEEVELNRIVDGMLQAASGLPQGSDKKGEPSGLRAAAKVGFDGQQAVIRFLGSREAGLRTNESFLTAFNTWRKEIATIEQAVARNLESANQAEFSAVIARTRKQQEKDMQENDPQRIAALNAAARKSERPFVRSSRMAVLAALLVSLIVPIVFFMRSVRKDS